MTQSYPFFPVKRFVTPAPVPFLATEETLPSRHRILVFLPHSDDGRYFGGSLHLLNRRNAVRIVVMSPGFLGVDQDLPVEDKTRLRWEEAVSWARVLGFKTEQLIDFRADRTYTSQSIDESEMERLRCFVSDQAPTMVFIPNLSDTAQAINYNTRTMVVASLLSFIENDHRRSHSGLKLPAARFAGSSSSVSKVLKTSGGVASICKEESIDMRSNCPRQTSGNSNADRFSPVLLVEYPTNHVPILPPSDRNFVIFFNDAVLTRLRREANLEHRSQSTSCFDITESLVEAVHAISEADTIHYLRKRQSCAEGPSGITVDPRTSRGEHFSVTRLDVKGEPHAIVELRLKFPLSETDTQIWNREAAGD